MRRSAGLCLVAASLFLTVGATCRSAVAQDRDPWREAALARYAELCLDGDLDPESGSAGWRSLRADGYDSPSIHELVRTMTASCPGADLPTAVRAEHQRQVGAEQALSAPDRIELAHNRRLFPGLRGVPPGYHGVHHLGMAMCGGTLAMTVVGAVLGGYLGYAADQPGLGWGLTGAALLQGLLVDLHIVLAALATSLVCAAVVDANRAPLPPLWSEAPPVRVSVMPGGVGVVF